MAEIQKLFVMTGSKLPIRELIFLWSSLQRSEAESDLAKQQQTDEDDLKIKVWKGDHAEERFTFQYGPCKGDPGFRDAMADFLTSEYGGEPVHSEDVLVTAGATQGLHLISTVLFDRHTPVFMEDPSYFIAVKILREDFGMNIIPVPTDNEGIDVTVLEELLEKHRPAKLEGHKSPFWSFVYTIPTFNNPKGYCMSPDRCKAMIRLARKYEVLLLAEDVYNMLHYKTDQFCPPRLLSFDVKSDADYKGNVISNCTFSKILAPGLRAGWIEAPPRIMHLLEKSNTTRSGGSFNHYMSKLLAVAVQNGLLSAHLMRLRKEYSERMDLVCAELTKLLPAPIKCHNPKGGFFIWLELPAHIKSDELLKLAVEKYRVNFIFGSSTSPTGKCRNCARLSISFSDKPDLLEGVARFCNALKDIMSTTPEQQ